MAGQPGNNPKAETAAGRWQVLDLFQTAGAIAVSVVHKCRSGFPPLAKTAEEAGGRP